MATVIGFPDTLSNPYSPYLVADRPYPGKVQDERINRQKGYSQRVFIEGRKTMSLAILFMSVFAFVVGLLICFGGYRLFLFLLPIWGFFAGIAIGAGAVSAIFGQGFLASVTGIVVGIIVGLVFAVLSYLFYFIGVAIYAASIGYGLGSGLMYAIFADPRILAFIVGIVVAVILALVTLGLNLQKYVIILISAFGGATVIVGSILLLFGVIDPATIGSNPVLPVLQGSILWAIVWGVVAILGFVIQMLTTTVYEVEVPEDGRAW